jgi:hypothetical protein
MKIASPARQNITFANRLSNQSLQEMAAQTKAQRLPSLNASASQILADPAGTSGIRGNTTSSYSVSSGALSLMHHVLIIIKQSNLILKADYSVWKPRKINRPAS